MALSKATGVSAMPTGSATQTISLGFSDGKCAWLWLTLDTAQDTFDADAVMAWGLFDGTDSFAVAAAMQDGQATTVANRYHYQGKALIHIDNTGALVNHCTAAFSGSDLVLTWNSTPGTAYLVHYLVLGGTDITGCKLKVYTARTSTGNEARSGFGFAPDFIYAITNQDDSDPASGVGDNGGWISFGCAANKASRERLTGGIASEDVVAATAADTVFGTSFGGGLTWFCPQYEKGGILVVNGSVALASWDSDGYTEDWDAAAGAAWYYAVLGLKGLQYDIHLDLCPTSTGDDTQAGFGFQPEALLTWMSPVLSGGVTGTDISLGMGAATTTSNENAAWVGDNDAALTSESDQRSTATYMVLRAAAGTPTLDIQARLEEFNSDGFKQHFITAPATAAYQGWIAFGPAAAATDRRRTGVAMTPGPMVF